MVFITVRGIRLRAILAVVKSLGLQLVKMNGMRNLFSCRSRITKDKILSCIKRSLDASRRNRYEFLAITIHLWLAYLMFNSSDVMDTIIVSRMRRSKNSSETNLSYCTTTKSTSMAMSLGSQPSEGKASWFSFQ